MKACFYVIMVESYECDFTVYSYTIPTHILLFSTMAGFNLTKCDVYIYG